MGLKEQRDSRHRETVGKNSGQRGTVGTNEQYAQYITDKRSVEEAKMNKKTKKQQVYR